MLKSKILSSLKWTATLKGKSQMTAGNEYVIRLRRNGFSCAVPYHTNINDTLCLDDIMYCLILDSDCYESCDNVHEFARSFGYDDMNEACKAYRGCQHTYMKVHELFTEAEINALRNELADN